MVCPELKKVLMMMVLVMIMMVIMVMVMMMIIIMFTVYSSCSCLLLYLSKPIFNDDYDDNFCTVIFSAGVKDFKSYLSTLLEILIVIW